MHQGKQLSRRASHNPLRSSGLQQLEGGGSGGGGGGGGKVVGFVAHLPAAAVMMVVMLMQQQQQQWRSKGWLWGGGTRVVGCC
jgi:hypothetical protein